VKSSKGRSRRVVLGGILSLVLLGLFFFFRGREVLARPDRSFDEIRRLVAGKNVAETLALLGEPDSRQSVFGGDLRFIWWRKAFLAGNDHPPEQRGQIVHIEIIFRKPGQSEAALAGWPMDEVLGVQYRLPEPSLERGRS
jgi:hypothetical protein